MLQSEIPGSGKIVDPLKVHHLCSHTPRDLGGFVRGAGVRYDNLINQGLRRLETLSQTPLLVLNDHDQIDLHNIYLPCFFCFSICLANTNFLMVASVSGSRSTNLQP